MRTRRIALVAAVAVLASLLLAFGAFDAPEGVWLEVERRDLVTGVDIEGELEAIESATVAPPSVPNVWQYKISFLATDGADVQAGQPVIGFDTTQLRQQLEQLSSQRDTAAAELEKTVADLRREESDLELRLSEAEARLRKANFTLDVPEDVTARRELEKSRIDRDIAQLEIDHLRADLEHLERRRQNEIRSLTGKRDLAASKVEEIKAAVAAMNVKAPRAGTVILRSDWRGDKPKVGDQMWRGRTILEIPDLERLRATVNISEADIGRVEPGQSVTFRLDAYPDLEYRATVARIRRAVQPRSPSDRRKIVKAQLELEDTDGERMRPGMRLRGTIEVERLEARVAVPQDAVFQDADGAYVRVRGLFGADRRAPELGRRDGEYFEVLDGLDEGDRVLGRGESP
ncbi:MAG: HlyD family efflux transporter periplasmic adaptor subunit [Acidobacteriota bacterium]